MQLRLLGPVDLVDAAGRPVALGGPKERRVLAALAVHLDQPVSEARLIDALWGDAPPTTATKTLQSYVSRLRKVLAGSDELRIDSVESGYVLRSAPGAVDTAEVDALVAGAREEAAEGRLEAAVAALRAADGRWRGPVLGDLADEPFALAEASRLEELRLSLVEERIELDLGRGRHAELVGELEALTTRHPLRERLWRARMLALYRSGRQADALRAFQDLRRLLGDELGIDPAPELRALEDAILQQASSLDLAEPSAGSFPTPASGALPTGVVTFLLTDVEGSTRLWDTAAQAMDAALRRHDAILTSVVAAHGGRLLKSRGEGDSSFSVFARASQAAAAALDAQAALAAEPWPPGASIRVRMAIHMGEAAEREQDYYGPAVNRVARLRALAAGGEILVSRSTAEVLADQVGDEFHLVELGERTLKDLSRPEHVFALATSSANADFDDPSVPLPAGSSAALPAAAHAATPALTRPPLARVLVRDDLCLGREEQLARLDNLWDKAQDGLRQAVLVAGEPGIGKTTLAAALARRAHHDGGLVLYGRCDEDLGVPFQPFTEALRSLVAVVPDDQLRALRHQAAHLARLLPELAERLPDLAPAVSADPEAERYSLFEAVVTLLAGVVADTPVVLVLDDLHWAGKPTLLLLRHLLRAEVELRLLIVATYRDTEVDRSHAFAEVLADLRRDVAVERVALTGLDRMAVQHLVAATAGQELDGPGLELSDALHRETGGNPFFVAEVLRHLAESGAIYQDADGRWTSDVPADELGLPEGVRDVVGRRLSRLSPAANQALSVGAVVGPAFDLRLLEAVPDAGHPRAILNALEEGVTAGLLSEDRGSYAFPHALVRQTLLEELSSTRRLRLHRRIGEALESVAPEGVEALAFHFAEAASADPEAAAKACDYALAAARRAHARSAHEEAIAHLDRGLEAVESTVPLDRTRRCDLLLELGELQRRLLGRSAEARRRGVQAAEDARALGLPDRLARAACVAMYPEVGTPDPVGVALVEEALAVLAEGDLAARLPLVSLLASHRTESEGRWQEGAALREEVRRLAREVPPETAAAAIIESWQFNGSAELDFMVEILSAIPAERLTAEQLTLIAQVRAVSAFDAGDLEALDARLDDLRRLADETHAWTPGYMALAFSISRALLDGRWDDAAVSLGELADQVGDNLNALNVWSANQFILLRDQGRHDEVLPLMESAIESNPGIPAFRAGRALLLAELGRLGESGRTFAPMTGDVVEAIPQDQVFSVTLAMVAEVAARTRHEESCRCTYDALLPSAGGLASVIGTVVVGAADRYLGMLAATLGRFDDAERHYESAIDLEERLGARPYLVRTRTWYARMLIERAKPDDRERALAMLSTALADANDLGMAVVAAEIRELLRPPLPAVLARSDRCVGRADELARLALLFDNANDGARQTALLAGEPGIGKTTLAATFARQVHGSGALVVYGRCDEDLGVAFQPFAEALRSLVAVLPDDLVLALGHHAGHLSRLLPELTGRLPSLAPPIPADAEAERYSLFEAVVALLASAAREAPVLLVLDDLHWAAKPTMLMLRHLARAETAMRVMVVGTYRDTEVDRSHPFGEVLADLRRDSAVERLALSGLDVDAVQEMVATTAGHALDGSGLELTDALHRHTNGNPFFVAEVLRHLAETGAVYQDAEGRWTSDLPVDELGLPEGVRDVVGRRLSRLSPAANQALSVGAVVGPGFELRLLESIPEAGDSRGILDALEEGVTAGLLSEDRGTYWFAHALVRQTLLEELTSTRRLRLHRRIGEALELVAPEGVEALAFHFAESAGADPEAAAKACDYALAAARPARTRSAHEEAIMHLERGLEAVESTVPLDRTRRCDLLLELGELHRWFSSQPAAATDLGVRAAADARAIGSTERLARAAAQAMQLFVGTPDAIGVALVEEALTLLPEDDFERRINLLLLLAAHRTEAEGRAEEGVKLSAEAFALARLAPAGMAEAVSSAWVWGTVDEIEQVVRWLSRVPPERRTAQQLTLLAQARAVTAFEVGDVAAVDAVVLQLQELAEETHGWSPTYIWLAYSITRALMDGRWDAAEVSLNALASHAGENVNALNVWAGNQFVLLRDRGELEALLPVIESASESNPGIPGFRAGHALLLAEQGRAEMASRVFAPLAGAAISTMPHDEVFPVTLAMVAEVAARLQDVESCEFAYRSMSTFGGRLATASGTIAVGAADRYLGMLAATLGRYDDAERQYEAAIDLEERLGARPYLVRTRTWYARMLLERAGRGDRDKARGVLATALADADDLGMMIVAQEIRELLRPSLPLPLTRPEGAFFVGRNAELDRLITAWDSVTSGERRCVLLGGEPGVGKTRLAAELARRAHTDDATVLFGRCDEGMGVPYQPFVEALRHLIASSPPSTMRAHLGSRGGELTRLLPELAEVFPDLTAPTRAEPESERYLLFESVAGLLAAAAVERPLLLVLDDLHWATAPTLLMLRHVLQVEASIPMLVVGTYRDTDLDADHPLVGVLADLRRAVGVERLDVGGLDGTDVAAYVAAAAGHDLDDRARALAEALHDDTRGNPFFIAEVLAHLIETGVVFQGDDGHWTAEDGITAADLTLPTGIKEVVTERLRRLSDAVAEALTIAAIVGQEFELSVVEAVADADVLDAMEEAATAGLVTERGPGRYAFVHALVRQSLTESLSSTRRVRLHRRVGEALERLPNPDARSDALALHFAEAAQDGNAAKAADYALTAGQAAFDRLAAEEADAIFQRGLAALEHEQPVDQGRRVDLLTAIASMHLLTERFGAYHPSAMIALEEARALGDPERFARAVMVRCQLLTVADDPERVGLCEDALAQIGDRFPGLRAGLLADIASYYVMSGTNLEEAAGLAEESLALARSSGEQLRGSLFTRALTMLGTPEVAERRALIEELLGLWAAADTYRALAVACFELADIGGFTEATEMVRRRAGDAKDDFGLMFSASFAYLEAMIGGRFDDASAQVDEVVRLGDLGDPNTMAVYSGALYVLTRERGELETLMPALVDVVEQNATVAAFRCVLAHALADLGRLDDARRELDELVSEGEVLIPRDYAWTVSLSFLAETAVRLGDRDRAALLAERLVAHSGHLVVTGWGVACLGAVDRYLGMLATVAGRLDEAEERFEDALGLEERIESPPFLARTRTWYARMLLARDNDGDAAKAHDLLVAALTDAEALGMPALATEIRELNQRL